ncbi:signal peptidase I [Rhodoflexus sp.]
MNSHNKADKHAKPFRQWIAQAAVAFAIASLIQMFAFEVASLRSADMSPTLFKDDWILVSKLHYGPRTPATLLKIPLTESYIGDSIPTFLKQPQLPVFRLPGFTDIKHRDVIYFNHPRVPQNAPADMRAKFVGRCIGLPGDSVRIDNLIASHITEDTARLAYPYSLLVNHPNPVAYLHELGIAEVQTIGSYYVISCTGAKAAELQQQAPILQINRIIVKRGLEATTTFPYSVFFEWNQFFFGPLWIPKKGHTIVLNDTTLALYDWLLEYEQGTDLHIEGNGYDGKKRIVRIKGQIVNQYTFQQNYYFVLNDNRSAHKTDSRRFGLIPENFIIGKAWLILLSIGDKYANNLHFFQWIR